MNTDTPFFCTGCDDLAEYRHPEFDNLCGNCGRRVLREHELIDEVVAARLALGGAADACSDPDKIRSIAETLAEALEQLGDVREARRLVI